MILEGIALISLNLRQAVAQPSNRQARRGMMLASMIGGIAISSKWLGACHSLAHQLSSFGEIHHGVAIALMLPHQMALSLRGAPDRYSDIADALDGRRSRPMPDDSTGPIDQAEIAVKAVSKLISDVGLPTHLNEVGISEELIPSMAKNAYLLDGNWPTNPCTVDEADFVALYQQAF
jgi:1,3-propanediol dehydrogenase